jgi:hypothetical protein
MQQGDVRNHRQGEDLEGLRRAEFSSKHLHEHATICLDDERRELLIFQPVKRLCISRGRVVPRLYVTTESCARRPVSGGEIGN